MQHLSESCGFIEAVISLFMGKDTVLLYLLWWYSAVVLLVVSIATLSIRVWNSGHYSPLPAGGETPDGSLPALRFTMDIDHYKSILRFRTETAML